MWVPRHWIAAGLLIGGLVAAGGVEGGPPSARPDVLRDGFETPRPSWEREYTDTTVRLLAQDRSDRAAHGGRRSEHFQFQAGAAGQFFVSYALPKVPVTEDLGVSLHVRSNRAGVQLFGRVVLPADVDPETNAPSFVTVPGTIFNRVDRWERLELTQLLPAIEQQARVLRASSRRPVPLKGAYLERVVVNLMGGGGGETEVFLDDLQVGPVPHELATAWAPGAEPAPAAASDRAGRSAPARDESALPPIRLIGNRLEKLSKDRRYLPWFPTAIDAPGANVPELRRAGNDVLVTAARPDPRRIQTALKWGFFLMPRLSPAQGSDRRASAQAVLEQMAAYPHRQSVAFWQIGDHLGRHRERAARKGELDQVRAALAAMRGRDDEDSHLATATVEGELRGYARSPWNLDAIGIQPRLWGGSQSFAESLKYLDERRALAIRSNATALFWAWIPATTPPEVVRNIWGDDPPPHWGIPPVQPEQLRLMTYLALSAGYRGLTFLGDADLTRPAGRTLLYEMSFLNAEIDLLEEVLARNVDRIPPYDVFDPPPAERPTTANVNMKRLPLVKEFTGKAGLHAAAVPLKDHKGAVLLISDLADGAQCQPPQMAYHNLTVTPILPQNVQALEISPGDARFLEQRPDDRVPGGTRFILPDFGTTTILVCTSDIAFCQRIQAAVRKIRPLAVQLAIEQAELRFAEVRAVHQRLKDDGHDIRSEVDIKKRRKAGIEGKPPDADDLFQQAEEFLKNARAARDSEDYATAWSEARRASRPLRLVMREHWQQALGFFQDKVGESLNPKPPEVPPGSPKPPPSPPLLVTAVSGPPCVSFFTLPELYIWADWIAKRPGYRFGRNRVPSGSFDDPDAIAEAGWMNVSYQVDPKIVAAVEPAPRRKADKKKTGNTPPTPEDQRDDRNRVIKLSVKAEKLDLDTILPQFLDFPAAAIRSPPIPVETNNLIRISVLVKRSVATDGGAGGIIVRDTIGGEQFQFHSTSPIPDYSRVVLYRKAPADGTFTVTLGLAGYGEAFFDDFRVEIIEEDPRYADPTLVQERPSRRRAAAAPTLPDPRLPAETAARPADSRRPQR